MGMTLVSHFKVEGHQCAIWSGDFPMDTTFLETIETLHACQRKIPHAHGIKVWKIRKIAQQQILREIFHLMKCLISNEFAF